jgi:hypothetical protein
VQSFTTEHIYECGAEALPAMGALATLSICERNRCGLSRSCLPVALSREQAERFIDQPRLYPLIILAFASHLLQCPPPKSKTNDVIENAEDAGAAAFL